MPVEGRLHLSKDRKVSPKGYDGGTYLTNNGKGKRKPRGYVASLANSFGLPAGHTCPGATAFCESCYALDAETYRTQVARAMDHNLDLLLAAGTVEGMEALLVEMLGRFRHSFDRTGLPERDRVFRIHWDGDFFSIDYAEAWASVIAHNPDVRFWVYTRSFRAPVDVVPNLAPLANCALYLSTDEYNWGDAHAVVARWPQVRLALCATDYRQGRDLALPGTRPIVCPENKGTLPLMNDSGRGACVECLLCVKGNRDIIFSTSHVEDVDEGQNRLFGNAALTPPVTVPVAIRPRTTSS